MATTKDRKVSAAEYSKHFSEQVNDADGLYAESLQRLKKLRGARKSHQKRELKRLSRKLGEDHPRVQKKAERIVREKEKENYIGVASAFTHSPSSSSQVLVLLIGYNDLQGARSSAG